MNKNKYLPWLVAAGFVASLAIALPTFAQTQVGPSARSGHFGGPGMGMMPGVFGTVTAINNTTLTVTGNTRPGMTNSSGTVYTVDASSARVLKNGTTSAVSDIATGDMVMVRGTVSGTNVAATMVIDGVTGGFGRHGGMPGGMGRGFGKGSASTSPASPIQGNGEPVIAGTIASISGTSLTVTNASNVTYTVDASNAKIVKGGATTTVSGIATGDSVVIQGTVNGTSVTASSVIDQTGNHAGASAGGTPPPAAHVGFFGSIGNFFKHIFGF